ncbi:hypothetical protein CRI77_04915 [Mycolicibacterium duvalii]|uniref:Uncharacterized protein n=1 Tax=Mycolicibacterium duvalii TaxID=39688 RepID=A0A7I7JZQ3_9MYCO|nr:hypothetical protein CRI77_04915 [Mycolicibacterium duvalii]BBX17297.1 hypothetical protein MDUV_21570 [Mycolicibacterium duvalii]
MFGAAAIAVILGGLAQPAIANALWDIGKYDSCQRVADELLSRGKASPAEHLADSLVCCAESGGEWSAAAEKCTAPPLTGPPAQSPVIQAPGTGTATQSSPVGEAQTPGTGGMPPAPVAPQPAADAHPAPACRWGICGL